MVYNAGQWCIAVMHDSGSVLIPIPIPIPGLLWKPDYDSDSKLTLANVLIPIPIPVKSGIIPESIPIPESESCITGA